MVWVIARAKRVLKKQVLKYDLKVSQLGLLHLVIYTITLNPFLNKKLIFFFLG